MMKKWTLLLVFILCVTAPVQAHVVRWWEGFAGSPNSAPLRLILEPDAFFSTIGFIGVVPGDRNEECTVTVKIEPLDATIAQYVSIDLLTENPAKSVGFTVTLKAVPPLTFPLTFRVKGTWAATGLPAGGDCTAVVPNPFEVPGALGGSTAWVVQYLVLTSFFQIDTGGLNVGLQESCSPIGPWKTIGIGSKFSLNAYTRTDERYYRGITRVGGNLVGTIWDPAGKPQTGVTIELPEGGASSTLDSFGNYELQSLPYGDSEFRIWKPILYLDALSGLTHTQKVGLTVEIPTKEAYTGLEYWFDAQAFGAPKGDYVGWSAIGLARIDKLETYLYYDGGARPTGDQPRNGSGAEVLITPPTGMPFKIGRGLGVENFTENPAAGTWKITTTLQGESRTLSLLVPLQF